MDERSSKIYFGLCMLVLVWIGVYWAWEPGQSPKPRISISQPQQPETSSLSDSTSFDEPDPEPLVIEPVVPELQSIQILPPKPKLIPPEFQSHTVVRGEIMQDIAKLYYGKALMWNVIARANPRVDPLKLREGMTLRIPLDPNNIQGLVETPEGIQTTTSESADPVVEYLVQPGDSLSRIAQKYYGSARHADFIYQSNRDTLRSMDSIRVGQTLKLPPLDP